MRVKLIIESKNAKKLRYFRLKIGLKRAESIMLYLKFWNRKELIFPEAKQIESGRNE